MLRHASKRRGRGTCGDRGKSATDTYASSVIGHSRPAGGAVKAEHALATETPPARVPPRRHRTQANFLQAPRAQGQFHQLGTDRQQCRRVALAKSTWR
ncbi:MAG: hypothetical protein U1D30_20355 [Planctomycetota bacterium]